VILYPASLRSNVREVHRQIRVDPLIHVSSQVSAGSREFLKLPCPNLILKGLAPIDPKTCSTVNGRQGEHSLPEAGRSPRIMPRNNSHPLIMRRKKKQHLGEPTPPLKLTPICLIQHCVPQVQDPPQWVENPAFIRQPRNSPRALKLDTQARFSTRKFRPHHA